MNIKTAPTVPADATPGEFRLDVFTDAEPDMPLAVHYYLAADVDAALDQAHALLSCDNPDDRYGEVYQRRGVDTGEFVDSVHLPQPVGRR